MHPLDVSLSLICPIGMKLRVEKLIQEVKLVRSLDLGTDYRPGTVKGSIVHDSINSQLTQFPKHRPYVRQALGHAEPMYHRDTNQKITTVHQALVPDFATLCLHMTVSNRPARRFQ